MEAGAWGQCPCGMLSDGALTQSSLFQAFPKYEAFMNRLALAIEPLLDAAPVDTEAFHRGSLLQRLQALSTLKPLLQAGKSKVQASGLMSDLRGAEPIFWMTGHELEPLGDCPLPAVDRGCPEHCAKWVLASLPKVESPRWSLVCTQFIWKGTPRGKAGVEGGRVHHGGCCCCCGHHRRRQVLALRGTTHIASRGAPQDHSQEKRGHISPIGSRPHWSQIASRGLTPTWSTNFWAVHPWMPSGFPWVSSHGARDPPRDEMKRCIL